jgi:hypothetical protein
MESQGNKQSNKGQTMNVLTNRPSFIILSACQGKNIEQDTYQTGILREVLKVYNFPFKEVLGCYGSKKEVSFYVQTDLVKEFLDLSTQFNQECILFVDQDRQASLIRKNGLLRQVDSIGTFTQVKQDVALQSANFTYDHENNGYYICK